MFGHVSGGSAILAAECEALQQAQTDQDDRRRDADGRRVRQQADDKGRQAHDQNGDEEGVFAADDVADAAEHNGAERTDDEARGKGQQREDVARCLVEHRHFGGGIDHAEELRADDAGERTEQVEIIPFEDGTERGSDNDETFVLRHASGSDFFSCSYCGHCRIAPVSFLIHEDVCCVR